MKINFIDGKVNFQPESEGELEQMLKYRAQVVSAARAREVREQLGTEPSKERRPYSRTCPACGKTGLSGTHGLSLHKAYMHEGKGRWKNHVKKNSVETPAVQTA